MRRGPPGASTPPQSLHRYLEGYRWRAVTTGESGAAVYRLSAQGRPPLILKSATATSHLNLRDEGARLRWLGTRAPAAKVIAMASGCGHEWLLMTALRGKSAAETSALPNWIVDILADALRALHAIDVDSCPFDETLARKIERADRAIAAGLVEEAHFDGKNAGRSARSLFREMLKKQPVFEDLVVTHGDACLPNVIIDRGGFSGFIDCARLGRADRYHDLALACRSVEYDLGAAWVQPFLKHYGLDSPDRNRLAFYKLLDEFA